MYLFCSGCNQEMDSPTGSVSWKGGNNHLPLSVNAPSDMEGLTKMVAKPRPSHGAAADHVFYLAGELLEIERFG